MVTLSLDAPTQSETQAVQTVAALSALPPLPLPLPALPWRMLWREAALAWLWPRAGLALALYTWLTLQRRGGAPVTPADLLSAFSRWDAAYFYVPIGVVGYTRPIDLGFWPLYPALIHGAVALTGQRSATVALLDALALANLSALVAALGVAALAAQWAQERGRVVTLTRDVRLALSALCCAPFAFWLVMPYTDALLLACGALALVALRRGAWGWAALLLLVAALTRPTSVALLAPALWEGGRWLRDGRGGQRWRRPVAWLLAGAPVVAWLAASAAWVTYADARLRALHAPAAWQTSWLGPVSAQDLGFGHNLTPATSGPLGAWRLTLAALGQAPLGSWLATRVWLDLAPLVVALPLLIWLGVLVARRQAPAAWLLHSAALWLLCVSAPVSGQLVPDPLLSSGRYLLAAAPLYPLWARLCGRYGWLERATWQVGLPLQVILLAYVWAGGWLV